MKKQLRTIAFAVGIGIAPLCCAPVLLHAQEVNRDQRAYDAGYQRGVNDARSSRPMDMRTDDWHGDRLNDYQRGYREGYNSATGYRNGEHGYANAPAYHDHEDQRAYQSGYDNGQRDAQRNRAMNMSTGDWRGDRLNAYQEGYRQGYQSVGGNLHHEHHDDDDAH